MNADKYQPLFDYLSEEHGLILLQSEMQDMIRKCEEVPKTPQKGISFVINIGGYGGFYIHNGFSKRICLGWIAFTYYPIDIDSLIEKILIE